MDPLCQYKDKIKEVFDSGVKYNRCKKKKNDSVHTKMLWKNRYAS